MEDNDKYGVSYSTSKNKIDFIKIKKTKKKKKHIDFFLSDKPLSFC